VFLHITTTTNKMMKVVVLLFLLVGVVSCQYPSIYLFISFYYCKIIFDKITYVLHEQFSDSKCTDNTITIVTPTACVVKVFCCFVYFLCIIVYSSFPPLLSPSLPFPSLPFPSLPFPFPFPSLPFPFPLPLFF
jgi:hypothetical protein